MRIFIDSADIDEIKYFYDSGIADGITTNPSLIKKALEKRQGVNIKDYLTEILQVAKGTPVSLEVTKSSSGDMINEGRNLYKMFNSIAKNVVIKIPINTSLNGNNNFEGIKAIKVLNDEKIPVNATLIFTPEQALLAAKAGAIFVSPFAGRVDDFLRESNKIKFEKSDYFPAQGLEKSKKVINDNGIISGIDLVTQCVEIFKNYNLKTQVLAASLRNVRQVRECALVGAGVATLNFQLIKEMLIHKKTIEGVAAFAKDTVLEYADLIK